MFATAFRTLGTAPESVGLSLVPQGREEEVDAVHKQWYGTLLNGVYRAVSEECRAVPCRAVPCRAVPQPHLPPHPPPHARAMTPPTPLAPLRASLS